MIRCRAILAATMAVGCTGQIVGSGPHSGGSGTGSASSTGTGSSSATTGAGGTGISVPTGAGGTAVTTGAGGTSAPTVCTPGLAPTSQIARLTNSQYDRAVADLLGVTVLAA